MIPCLIMLSDADVMLAMLDLQSKPGRVTCMREAVVRHMGQNARVHHHLVHAALKVRQLLHKALQPGCIALPRTCALLQYNDLLRGPMWEQAGSLFRGVVHPALPLW